MIFIWVQQANSLIPALFKQVYKAKNQKKKNASPAELEFSLMLVFSLNKSTLKNKKGEFPIFEQVNWWTPLYA